MNDALEILRQGTATDIVILEAVKTVMRHSTVATIPRQTLELMAKVAEDGKLQSPEGIRARIKALAVIDMAHEAGYDILPVLDIVERLATPAIGEYRSLREDTDEEDLGGESEEIRELGLHGIVKTEGEDGKITVSRAAMRIVNAWKRRDYEEEIDEAHAGARCPKLIEDLIALAKQHGRDMETPSRIKPETANIRILRLERGLHLEGDGLMLPPVIRPPAGPAAEAKKPQARLRS